MNSKNDQILTVDVIFFWLFFIINLSSAISKLR
jgi:hypothetical protein